MRKIIVTEFMTLDGIVQDPHLWSFPYWNDAIGEFKHAELFTTDEQLLGRVTYQGFAEAWPSRDGDFADRLNSVPKYVVSTTLQHADWNNSHIINNNIAAELTELKQQPGQDILVHGSPTLVRSLMKDDLVDQYHLLIYPIVLGSGIKLFDAQDAAKLKLVDSKTFSTGVVALIYQPA